MTAGPCVSLPKIESVSEKPSSAAHLGGQRRSLTGRALNKAVLGLAARTGQGARFGVRAHAKADLGGEALSRMVTGRLGGPVKAPAGAW